VFSKRSRKHVLRVSAQAAQALSMNHTSNTTWHRITRAYMGVKIINKNGLPYSVRVLFTPGVVILSIELDLSDFFEFRFFLCRGIR